jgi:glucose-1-phosphate cytidylyltransferase
MKVVLLCGGLGTRLREETEFRPKPMVSIGNRPILWHIMKTYSHFGFNHFVLALGYKGEMIKEYFYHFELMNNDLTLELGHPEKFDIHRCYDENEWKVTMVDTGEKALKGARLKRIEGYIEEDELMVAYGDSLADIDLGDLLRFHRRHGKLATVTGVNIASRFGELRLEGDRVTAFNEKPEITDRYINGGFFVFSRKIFEYLSSDDACDLEVGALENLAHEGQLMVYKHPGLWSCMDTYRDMEHLNHLWDEGEAFWKVWG